MFSDGREDEDSLRTSPNPAHRRRRPMLGPAQQRWIGIALAVMAGIVTMMAALQGMQPEGGAGPGGGTGTSGRFISRGVPTFASGGEGDHANDADYGTSWSPGGEGWLAFDLSNVPEGRRREAVLLWFASPDDGLSTSAMQGVCPAWRERPLMQEYSIEVNDAAGGGAPPTSGWVELVSVVGNDRLSAQHHLDIGGRNWVRLAGSGAHGISINVDIAEASSQEGWLFLGDSITAGYAGHAPLAAGVPSLTDLIADRTGQQFLVQNAGTSCAKAGDALVWVNGLLDSFPGRYVTLNFGGNDGWGGAGDPETFRTEMLQLVDRVLARGKVPVIPTVTWPNNGGDWDTGIQELNRAIEQVYEDRPEVIAGPDLYKLLRGRTELYREPGDVHLNDAGLAEVRFAWAEVISSLERNPG